MPEILRPLLQVIDAKPEHIGQLLAKPLRELEAHNWITATRGRSLAMVLYNLRKDNPGGLRAVLNDRSECICIWAVSPMLGWGCLWLLASEEAESAAPNLSDYLLRDIDAMHERYGNLTAHAHRDDVQLIQWLEAAGFRPSGSMSVECEEFIVFAKRSER